MNFLYDKLIGKPFSTGESFDIAQVQVEQGLTVTPKRYGISVSAYIDKIKLELAGPTAVMDYVDTRLQVAAMQMAAQLAVAAYNNGQDTGRTKDLNGLEEALNDGNANGWNGSSYSSYLGITRADVRPEGSNGDGALDSVMTDPAADVSGGITHTILEKAWNSVVYGSEQPDLICTTNLGMSLIKIAFQAQQRFEGSDSAFGFRGILFNGSRIMQDRYAPGTQGINDSKIGSYLDASGETIWILNTKYINLYVSTDDLMGFGFTGFKPAQDNLTAAGQYLFAGNLVVPGPRYSRYLFNVT